MGTVDLETLAASISFRQLRLFEAVARLRSVRRASDACNVSQPAVTQTLARLEAVVGTDLFRRHASGSYLTEAGETFHRRVLQFLDRTNAALRDLGVPGGEEAIPTLANRLSRSKVRGLIAIVDNPVLEQAAQTVGLSEVTVQRATRSLELALECRLLVRTSNGLALTQEAIRFGRALKLAMQEVEWGVGEVQTGLGGAGARIMVGALVAGASVLLGQVLDEFVTSHPGVEVSIASERSRAMLGSLRAGDIDLMIGLLKDPVPDDLVTEAFARTPYVVACRRGHRLLKMGQVTLEDLRAHEWVTGADGTCRRACFEALFAGGALPAAPISISSVAVLPHLMGHRDRLTLLTSYELEHEAGMLVAVPFALPLRGPQMGVTLRRGWQPTRAHADFIDLARIKMAEQAGTRVLPRLAG